MPLPKRCRHRRHSCGAVLRTHAADLLHSVKATIASSVSCAAAPGLHNAPERKHRGLLAQRSHIGAHKAMRGRRQPLNVLLRKAVLHAAQLDPACKEARDGSYSQAHPRITSCLSLQGHSCLRISRRAAGEGTPISSSRSKRPGRLSAASTASTRLVAASTTTPSGPDVPARHPGCLACCTLFLHGYQCRGGLGLATGSGILKNGATINS